jgi:LCP family protein required for cell wall assembly
MAPDTQDNTQETDAVVSGEPTATPDPYAALRFWEVDPDKTVYNILLLGMGQEEPGTIYGHNDTTMILQINLETNEMRLVSFMRDMLVEIPGKGEKRINNTHLLGGPDLVKRTMKSVFGVDIDYYATVNFVTFEQIMRIVGTIMIDVQEYEVEHLKKAESAVSVEGEMILGQGVVQNEGTYEFNEYLALSYARDRHSERTLDDGTVVYNDRGRNERQREVVKAAWEKVKSKPLSMIPPSVFLAMPYVETDMNEALIITLLKEMMANSAQIVDMSVPNSNWEEWKAKDGTQYTNDELESLYNQKKAEYENSHKPAEPTNTGGEGEVTAEPTATAEVPAFPSYETWRKNEEFASVIEWSHNKTIGELHDFLGID